jgi:hypothetical protein
VKFNSSLIQFFLKKSAEEKFETKFLIFVMIRELGGDVFFAENIAPLESTPS